jgi:RimJ/RimL family protein N-acetyltransferase
VSNYVLGDGRQATIRPIRASDELPLRTAYANLSPESKYRRFLAAKPRLTSADTRYLVRGVDGYDHVALVATLADDSDCIIGVARFVRQDDDPSLGELAIVVADSYQRQGLGSELMRRLAGRADAVGVTRLRGTTLAENRAAHRLLRRTATGAVRERARGYIHEIEIEISPLAGDGGESRVELAA